jgi:MYXO-CTERM domain-containing protein
MHLRRRLAAGLFLTTLCSSLPAAAELLRYDSIEEGDEVGFATIRAQDGEYGMRFDGPEGFAQYAICGIYAWIGPNGFNVFTVRIDGLGDNPVLIWQSDLVGYQLTGSPDAFNYINLRDQRIVADSPEFLLRLRESLFDEPGPAFDSDGITPERNWISVLQRNGEFFDGYTEELPVASQPDGDWALRVLVEADWRDCPADATPPMPGFDAGVPPPPRDASVDPPEPDAAVEPPPPELDAEVEPPPPEPDAEVEPPPPEPDSEVEPPPPEPDSEVEPPPPEPDAARRDPDWPTVFTVDEVTPERGPADRNTEIVIRGEGFVPGDADARAAIGDARLLEMEILSWSTITAIVPAGLPAGAHPISVERGDGQTAILPEAFTVVGDADGLAVTRVTPNGVRRGGVVELTIEGVGFESAIGFRVGTVELAAVEVDRPTLARATFAADLAPGTYDLVATLGDRQAVLEGALEVQGGTVAESGCDCSTSPDAPGPPALLWFVAALGVLRRRRL